MRTNPARLLFCAFAIALGTGLATTPAMAGVATDKGTSHAVRKDGHGSRQALAKGGEHHAVTKGILSQGQARGVDQARGKPDEHGAVTKALISPAPAK